MRSIDLAQAKAILLDIEGTTTPIDFVHKTLFGYARDEMRAFLARCDGRPEVRACVESLKARHAKDEDRLPLAWPKDAQKRDAAAAADYALWLMERDSKLGPLKTLQGLIWREGYESGRLRGQVYADVPRAFERWRLQGKQICIYSSGSVLAQRLLFGTTEFGDLTPCIDSYFDTQIGAKTSAESYRAIAAAKELAARDFLFLSDSLAELNAARSAGMLTALVVRQPEAEIERGVHALIENFDALA